MADGHMTSLQHCPHLPSKFSVGVTDMRYPTVVCPPAQVWFPAKQEWCCNHEKLGCPEKSEQKWSLRHSPNVWLL